MSPITTTLGHLTNPCATGYRRWGIYGSHPSVRSGPGDTNAALMGNDNTAPLPELDGAPFVRNGISWTRIGAPTYAIVHGNRYSGARSTGPTYMGPVTRRITDHGGYNSLISVLRTAHKTAAAAFPDGAKCRKDPTKVDAERQGSYQHRPTFSTEPTSSPSRPSRRHARGHGLQARPAGATCEPPRPGTAKSVTPTRDHADTAGEETRMHDERYAHVFALHSDEHT